MAEKYFPHPNPASLLPLPERRAYFPEISLENEALQREIMERVGSDNLVYAIQYGSLVGGDATPTSMLDLILVVEDTRVFHERNLADPVYKDDYGKPQSAGWHEFLNRFGLNFYHTEMNLDGRRVEAKYGVISRENFIRGCNGSLSEKERLGIGAFGFYVAGRMQKVALAPLLRADNVEKVAQIEEAINTARIDGIWLSLGLVNDEFSLDELLAYYVSLSYRADLRFEKPDKIATLIRQSRTDYEEMLKPMLEEFARAGLIRATQENRWQKVVFPNRREVEKRLQEVKFKTALINYLKNPFTVGLGKGIRYAFAKIKRAQGAKDQQSVRESPLRGLTKRPLEALARRIPLSANQITILGGILGVASAFLIEKRNFKDPQGKKRLETAGALLLLGSYLADVLDGPKARIDGTAGRKLGILLDTAMDRLVDGAPAIAGLRDAKGSESLAWKFYLVLHSLPAILRSYATKGGVSISELNPGSRLSRSAVIFTRTKAPDILKEPMVWAVNAITALGSWKRYRAIEKSGNTALLSEVSQAIAQHIASFIRADRKHHPAKYALWELGTLTQFLLTKNREIDEIRRKKNDSSSKG